MEAQRWREGVWLTDASDVGAESATVEVCGMTSEESDWMAEDMDVEWDKAMGVAGVGCSAEDTVAGDDERVLRSRVP